VNKRPQKSQIACEQPAVYDLLYASRDPARDDLLTTIFRAAEKLAAPACMAGHDSSQVHHAVPQTVPDSAVPTDYSGLQQVVEKILQLVEQDRSLAAQLNALPAAFGDGAALRALFINLFPDQCVPKILDRQGKAVLSEREVAILRMAAAELSHEQIADYHGIARATVRKHLNNIYKTLDVHKPLAALKRAAAMGYIGWGSVEDLLGPLREETCGFDPFQSFCTTVGSVAPTFRLEERRPLAAFGLLLLAVSGATARQRIGDARRDATPRGLVYRINARGEVTHRFGREQMRTARAIAIAPLRAAEQGFTPGNLFVAHDQVPQRGLNRGAITEFTPDGEYVRTFCGGEEIGTRLIGMSLSFAADGRLLATSGWLTNAILAFSAGGIYVERFTDDHFMQVCCGRLGLYATQVHNSKPIVKILDHSGKSVGVLTAAAPNTSYHGIAVSESEHIYVVVRTENRDLVEEFDENGIRVRDLQVPAGRIGKPAVDGQGRVIIPYNESGYVVIVEPDGTVQSRIELGADECAMSVAVAADGAMFVCCAVP
jgi:DNA-binding NarL/FixJ family response regulator